MQDRLFENSRTEKQNYLPSCVYTAVNTSLCCETFLI